MRKYQSEKNLNDQLLKKEKKTWKSEKCISTSPTPQRLKKKYEKFMAATDTN